MILKLIENTGPYDLNHNHIGLFFTLGGLAILYLMLSWKVNRLEKKINAD